ncbi:MAG: glycoside hydrolase family 3 N-terminal domain-containing protein [Thermoleophilaceae bacterium]
MGDPRGPSPSVVLRRRVIPVVVVLAVAAGLWLLLFRSDDEEPAGAPPPEPARTSGPVAELAARLTPEELVDQVLLLGFEGTDASAPFLDKVRARQLGGVLIDRENWLDSATGTALAGGIRAAGREGDRIPPLIVTSQEGGPYRALADLPPEETQLEIGDSRSAQAAEDWATGTAEALAAAGIDLNLAPLADVATLDSAVSDRAFSDDPAATAELTAASVRGCRSVGVACAVLHFPGLGAASQDTSRGPATVGLDPASLEDRDLVPFQAAFAERVPAVVLSLALYTAYDPVTPGALAEPVATGLLRDELGFEGVAITDDLGAGAVRAGQGVDAAAVDALAAGPDMVQIRSPTDQAGVRKRILEALESRELPEGRLREAATRVLELKRDQSLIKPSLLAPDEDG